MVGVEDRESPGFAVLAEEAPDIARGSDPIATGREVVATQAKFRAEADRIFDANAAKYDAQQQEAIEFFKKEGKQVYTPDVDAFRRFAQKRYVERYGKDWPSGALERINAIK